MATPVPVDEWVSYRDALPLTWAHLPDAGATPEIQREHLLERNLKVLAVVATLEERRLRPDGAGAVEAEVERLHHKVDVLLELAGALLRLQHALPEPLAIRLSREGAVWQATNGAPEQGMRVLLAIHLHPCAVHPFAWPATVSRAGGEVCAHFEPLGDALGAALEKHVFMHHRRSVAGSRQPSPG